MEKSFRLSEEFVEGYSREAPPFGFNGLGELVYLRTYSRLKPDGKKEKWFETVRRVVEGTFDIIIKETGGNPVLIEAEARTMYEKMFQMKFLPPGRGLWAMGTDIIKKHGGAALNNCAFISTEGMGTYPFVFAMDALMLGIGVGFDVKGAGTVRIHGVGMRTLENIRITDSREGWIYSVQMLLSSYFEPYARVPEFDYDGIRSAGSPIKTFGGTASGPDALKNLHLKLKFLLDKKIGGYLDAKGIVDIFNLIGCCVVAGNVRRSAEIAIGPPTEEFMSLKNYMIHPDRMGHGWSSNNSVVADPGSDYDAISKHITLNGEPGLLWLDNMKEFGRLCDGKDYADYKASGGNPCLEITLESKELCCLVETFPAKHGTLSEFLETLYYAILYAKAVTMVPVHWEDTRKIIARNRRIGVSVSGIAQFLSFSDLESLRIWLEAGYQHLKSVDSRLSWEWKIPTSKKITCVKPSGSVSLLAGATPGCHLPISRYYIRRVRLGPGDDYLIQPLKKSGYKIEEDRVVPGGFIAEFPIDVGGGVRTLENSTMWEQILMAAFLQKYWADNQVSCTVTFDPSTEGPHIATALRYFCFQLKGISFLPKGETIYPQMPYEKISGADYHRFLMKSKPLRLEIEIEKGIDPDQSESGLCDNERCQDQ